MISVSQSIKPSTLSNVCDLECENGKRPRWVCDTLNNEWVGMSTLDVSYTVIATVTDYSWKVYCSCYTSLLVEDFIPQILKLHSKYSTLRKRDPCCHGYTITVTTSKAKWVKDKFYKVWVLHSASYIKSLARWAHYAWSNRLIRLRIAVYIVIEWPKSRSRGVVSHMQIPLRVCKTGVWCIPRNLFCRNLFISLSAPRCLV